MSNIEFIPFSVVKPDELLKIANEESLRTHLVDHPLFDAISLQEWMTDKLNIDATKGCRIRAVLIDGTLAGWCGIQPDSSGYELAIVISQRFWGYGIAIFKNIMTWAKEFGHKEILFHLLESRPEYKALGKMSTKVYISQRLGRQFTTYHVAVR